LNAGNRLEREWRVGWDGVVRRGEEEKGQKSMEDVKCVRGW
jgi:hypothetical protein